jgi:hypothetical protein
MMKLWMMIALVQIPEIGEVPVPVGSIEHPYQAFAEKAQCEEALQARAIQHRASHPRGFTSFWCAPVEVGTPHRFYAWRPEP